MLTTSFPRSLFCLRACGLRSQPVLIAGQAARKPLTDKRARTERFGFSDAALNLLFSVAVIFTSEFRHK